MSIILDSIGPQKSTKIAIFVQGDAKIAPTQREYMGKPFNSEKSYDQLYVKYYLGETIYLIHHLTPGCITWLKQFNEN